MKIKLTLVVMGGLIFCINVHGQTTVGMGTDAPNPNAVLELVSEHQNQGFLMPRFTTSQRNAPSFTALLSSKDNGLLVFDTDEGVFYYWYKDKWQVVSPREYNENTVVPVWLAGETIPTDNEGKDGDFYLHQSTGNVYRKQENTFVIIGNLQKQEQQYIGGTGINITDQNEIVNTGDIDPANELQHLNLSGSTLSLSGSLSTVDMSGLQDGTGTDSQTLSLSGNNLSISGGNNVDLSVLQDGTGTDSQTLSLSSNNLTISGGNSTDLSSYLDNTDSQNLSLSGNNLSISGGNSIDISSINTDSQTLSLAGDNLSIAGGNSVDLFSYLDNTDSQNLSNTKTGEDVTLNISGGTPTTFSVADNDSDAANETITNAILNVDTLEITEAGTTHTVDLSSIKGSTYTGGEGISVAGTTVAAKADGVTIGFDGSDNLKVLDNGITDTQIANVAPSKVLAEGAADGDVLTYNSGSGKWEPVAPSASVVTRYYSVDPTDFVSVNGDSDMEYNGVNGGSASTAGGLTHMIAPIHLPQGSVIKEVNFYIFYAVLGVSGITCSLQSKALNSEATTDHVTESTGGLLTSGNFTLTATGLNITIDNSTNSYRIKAEVDATLLGLDKHKVYGARITYTETL